MNSKRSKLMQLMVITIIMLGMLIAAGPGVAQNSPLLNKNFTEGRLHEITSYAQFTSPETRRSVKPAKPSGYTPLWETTTITGSGEGVSLALNNDGQTHVAYRTPTGGLQYAQFTWENEEVIPGGAGGHWTSLAVDATGHPHIAFDTSNGLNYATYRDHAWHTELVETGDVGAYGSLALDSSGQPYIGYYDQANGDLKYAYHDGITWHVETLDSVGDVGRITNLGLDSSNRPHLAYCVYDPGQGICSSLKYATHDANGWHFEIIDGPVYLGHTISMAIDQLNRPHVVYASNAIKYAVRNGTTWQVNTLWYNVSDVALAVDHLNSPHVIAANMYFYIGSLGWSAEGYDYLVGGTAWAMGVDGNDRVQAVYQFGQLVNYTVRATTMYTWSRLAYASYQNSNYEIFTARGDGAEPVQRTYNSAYDSMPAFNRGATRLAFVSNRDGNYEIYSMNVDGSGVVRLTATSANEYLPNWSPDGTKIAFYSLRDGNAEIYIMNIDGSNQTRLTVNTNWDGHPTWSPDGAHIAFTSDRSGSNEIWLMNADGSNQHQLTFGGLAAYPDWSPDGTRIIYNDDFNNDGWLDVAIINIEGASLSHPLGSSIANYDYLSPRWAPNGIDIAFAQVHWTLYKGNYYWTDAYVIWFDTSTGDTHPMTLGSGTDWWPTWKSIDASAPTIRAKSKNWHEATQFAVEWSGLDNGPAGVKSYDVQYRDGPTGNWVDWFTQSKRTGAIFTGLYGHTYYFRARARDYSNNQGNYSGGNGDTSITIYQYTLTGQVQGNREQPVTVATLATSPIALNTGLSRHDGLFDLYFASGGTFTLTVTRSNFGTLPPLLNVSVPLSNSLPTLYLPPLDDQISEGHFESGTLAAWNPSGDFTPTITTTAHTGSYAAALGGTIPSDTTSSGPYFSTIEQTINVPVTLTDGTLSLLYKIEAVEPLSDSLDVLINGLNDSISFKVPITTTDWIHQWFDVSAWSEPTATVQIQLTTPDQERMVSVLVDEVTWGSSLIGSHPVYLPIMRR